MSFRSISHWQRLLPLVAVIVCWAEPAVAVDFEELQQRFAERIVPLLRSHCWTCHATAKREGDLDLERFQAVSQIRAESSVWLKVVEMLDSREMPPRESPQLSATDLATLRGWLQDFIHAEAEATAGDPGPVVLRRLNNAEYTYTIQDLTGQPLEPARQFPVDSAAGEGFTNAGAALVMSPAMLSKYMDAAKGVAEHALLLRDGIGFSPYSTRRDWTDDVLRRLREFYSRYTDPTGSTRVKLQGLEWDTNAGGRLPLKLYLTALVAMREDLRDGRITTQQLAEQQGLNAKYVDILWQQLTRKDRSALLHRAGQQFATISADQLPQWVDELVAWQQALTRFQSVGHMKPWLAPVDPLVTRQEIKLPLKTDGAAQRLTVELLAGVAGDDGRHDVVRWQQPRLVAPGRVDIAISDLPAIEQALERRRVQLWQSASGSLAAAAQALGASEPLELAMLAERHSVDLDSLRAWFDFLSIAPSQSVRVDQLLTERLKSVGGYDFVAGWGSPKTPSIVANSSDMPVRIPGNLKPHGVAVHPAPNLDIAVGWRSPISGRVQVAAVITHAHPECGNGVAWAIEIRRGSSRERLAAGVAQGGKPVTVPPIENVRMGQGELIALVVGPRDGNHSCDLTDIEFTIRQQGVNETPRQWNLTSDVSPNLLAGNPHADAEGQADVWNFFVEPTSGAAGASTGLPPGSILKNWLATDSQADRAQLAEQAVQLFQGPRPAAESPDRLLWDQAHDVNGPLLGPVLDRLSQQAKSGTLPAAQGQSALIDAALGVGADGVRLAEPNQFISVAPRTVRLDIPAELCRGRELMVTASMDPQAGHEGSCQVTARVAAAATTDESALALTPSLPILVADGSTAREALLQAMQDFRQVFPAALCYIKIVPVDEVVTLALFHREDDNLQRLMLGAAEIAELDRLWDELHFVSHDLLTVEDAYEQLMQYATQDSDPKLFEHLRQPIAQRANDFRAAEQAAQPKHLTAVADLATRAFRRPLSEAERQSLAGLYQRLLAEGMSHDAAVRLLIVRVFVSTSFLYRLEQCEPGVGASPVSSWEMASRLSYFLWSGPPDENLRTAAADNQLQTPDQLAAHARRMLLDARVSRFSREFACQWLHIADVAALDEKSERHYPEFVGLREDFQREAEMFITDLVQRDGSVLEIFAADHSFLNSSLAKFYGIPGVEGDQWRKVNGVGEHHRGGVLTMAAVLAKQSGASRTSPILRGSWISEVLLGEKLPKPPKDVPVLPGDEAAETLSVRQLVEKHTQDQRCAHCHARIDPFGFALESYDAIGRWREQDLAGHQVETATELPDGTRVADAAALRAYLVQQKRDVLVHQFCRKLLGYALGRAVRLSDQPLLAAMQSQLAAHEYRFSVAIEAIVRSQQFMQLRNADFPEELN